MAKKREMEYFEFATAQKSIIASSASVYLNEVSQNSFEKAYRCEMLPTSTVIADSPALDMQGLQSFATANDKTRFYLPLQFKGTNGKNSATAYRKFMANLMIIDSELSQKYELYVNLDTYPYKADFTVFNHIKKMPGEYDLYDFASSCDCVITDYHTILNVFKNKDLKLARFILDANQIYK